MSDEKEREKHEEKDEKGTPSDSLSAIIWALIVIWVGVVFLLGNLADDGELAGLNWENSGAWILLGIGVLIFLEVLVRLVLPAYRRPVGGQIVFGTILVIIGVSSWIDISLWPLVLIAIGVVWLLRYFFGQGRF
jgi:hypothetical protein